MSQPMVYPPSPTLSDLSSRDSDEYITSTDLKRDQTKSAFEPSSSQETLVDAQVRRFERRLGDSELSYYLPSRDSGVNDMYLHIGFNAPNSHVSRARVNVVWAILRVRHPLLACKIEMHDYNDVRFVYSAYHSPKDALEDADKNLEYRFQSKDELIDSYLNGPRTLSNNRLSYLILSTPMPESDSLPSPPLTPGSFLGSPDERDQTVPQSHELLICATHFLGDGMALHQFANDFFGLLGGSKSQQDLELVLQEEWQSRWGKVEHDAIVLPNSMEEKFPPMAGGKLRQVAARVDFQQNQEKLIGGQSFPRGSRLPRHTVVPTVPFDADLTKNILKNCKAHGVSISSALFAICDIAWARTTPNKPEMPTMMYSALNLRPYLTTGTSLTSSYWFLAVGYFNVILPTFLPHTADISSTFWHRARSAKEQSTHAAKNPMVVSRSREMARERGKRARAWAKEDDDKERGVWKAPPPSIPSASPRPPSNALLGLSLLGNLDGIYQHASFPEISLHTLTTGSRQRQGGMLLFGYTFASKLWLSLGYDENGFEKDTVAKFWENVLRGIEEFLIK